MRAASLIAFTPMLLLDPCSSLAPPIPIASPLPPSPVPTANLRPAPPTLDSLGAVPEGKYLFVEYFLVDGGTSPTWHCPGALMIDFPGYDFSSGALRALPGPLAIEEGIIGFAGHGRANAGAMGGGVSSQLEAIRTLPVSLANGVAVVHAVQESGEIVAEITGSRYLMGPGESWVQAEQWDPSPDCHRTVTYRFTNFGLLGKEQIRAK